MVDQSKRVTDPSLLQQLEPQGAKVTDPQLLNQLEGGQDKRKSYYSPESEEAPSFLDQLGRQAGLTARALAGGAAQIAEPFTEPVRYLMNKALPGSPIGNIEAATDEVMTSIGVPEPEGKVEEGVQSVGRFATGFAGGSGIANKADDVVHGALGLTKRAIPDAPTTEQLKGIANAAYKAADDVGLIMHPGSFKNFSERVAGITKHAGIDRDIHPKATAAVRRIQEAAESGKAIKLQDFEILRKVVRGARASIDKDERRIGSMIAKEMDDYISRIGSADVISGNPQAASAALNTARDAWTRMSKSDVIQEAVEKAGVRAGQFSGSGFENALRTQFRQIAMNPKRMRGFSQTEQEAIKKVAMGGPLDNAMRSLGKLAPTGVVSAGIGGTAGYAIGGPVGAVALPAAGAIARRGATKLTERNVDKLSDLVRRGSPVSKEAPDWLLPWLSGGIFGADTQEN